MKEKMKKGVQNITKFILTHKPQCIIALVAVLVLAASGVALAVTAGGRRGDDAQEAQNGSVSTQQTGGTAPESTTADRPDESSLSGEELDINDALNGNGAEELVFSFGIDVSKYQGKIDWQVVKNEGVAYAMIRVGARAEDTGEIVADPYAEYNLQQAAAVGLPVGVYFISTAVSRVEAVEEADWVMDFVKSYAVTYPIVYDCERYNYPENRMYGLSAGERTDHAIAFMQRVQSAGYEGMTYASLNAFTTDHEWDYARLRASGRLWVAYYSGGAHFDSTSLGADGSYDMWQYTQRGTVAGINGKVDLNVAYFSYEQSADAKVDGPVSEVNEAEVGITFTEVSEQVTAKEETNLRSTPETSGTLIATLYNGDVVQRTGIGSNGWSRLVYDGRTVYARTQFLTTDLQPPSTSGNVVVDGIEFYPVSDSVTAKHETNLRSVPSSESPDTVVATIQNGTYVKRIGMSERGWSRIEYNGQIVYAISSYLTQ